MRAPHLIRLLIAALAVAAVPAWGDGGTLFDPAFDGSVLDLVDPSVREAFESSLADAGRNWRELARAIELLDGEERDAAVWLVNGAPHLDRLEMTAEALVEHVRYAFRVRDEMPYPVPEEKFRPYILTYRIEEEPVDPWRKALFERYAPLAVSAGGIAAAARAVNLDLADHITEREREFFGPRQSPLLTLSCGSGTEAEIAILACAIMKAIGIPSREASVRALGDEPDGANWIEIFDGDRWVPLYPLEPGALGDFGRLERDHPENVTVVATRSAFESVLVTENYTDTGVVEFSFVANGSEASGYEHFSVSVLNRGALVPLDALEAVTDEDGNFEAVLGDGRYVLLAGVRDAAGNPFVRMREIDVVPGGRHVVAFDVTPGGPGEELDPELARSLGHVLEAVVLFDPAQEPDARMLPLIADALGRRSASVVPRYVSIGESGEGARELLPPRASITTLPAGTTSYRLPGGGTLPVPGESDDRPVVAVFELGTGAEVLVHRGYDLNIDVRLSKAIDTYLRERATR